MAKNLGSEIQPQDAPQPREIAFRRQPLARGQGAGPNVGRQALGDLLIQLKWSESRQACHGLVRSAYQVTQDRASGHG